MSADVTPASTPHVTPSAASTVGSGMGFLAFQYFLEGLQQHPMPFGRPP